MQGNTDVAYWQAGSEPVAFRLVKGWLTTYRRIYIIMIKFHQNDTV